MASNFRDRPLVVIDQEGTAEVALDAIDGTIDSMTRL